jgi:hypothetical protein
VTVADKVLIVRSEHEPFERVPYVIHLLIKLWRQQGLEVDVTTALNAPTGEDVLVFPHFDLTMTPPDLAKMLSRCARVVNRRVLDISKRTISRQLVTSPDEYEGRVIVKTNLNYAAVPELRLIERQGGPALAELETLKKQPCPVSGLLSQIGRYPVYASPREVPAPVWTNENLVVEKFLPEVEGQYFCLRQYTFLGSAELSGKGLSEKAVVKSGDTIKRDITDNVPPALRAFREELGFDYGKFDFVLRDGKPVVFDVNRTYSFDPKSKTTGDRIARLAAGIAPLLGAG